MHKIKELLQKDGEDSRSSSSLQSTHSHNAGAMDHPLMNSGGHSHLEQHSHTSHTHGGTSGVGEKVKEVAERAEMKLKKGGEHKKLKKSSEHQHLHSGEHMHGNLMHGEHMHGEHMHGEHMHGEHMHGEKHIMHEREALKDANRYRSGEEVIQSHGIASTTRHVEGTAKELIEEGKIVKESIKEVELHKVQPIVHREREQKEIRHVVAPIKEFEVKDTEIHHREREIDLGVRVEASTLATSRDMGAPKLESTREYLGKERQHQELPAMVEEHVHKRVEEHIHPVIYKEVLKPRVTEETHHIYEKVKEAPIETFEVREISRSRGEGLIQAEREFFAKESSRGMVLSEGHSCSCDIQHAHSAGHNHAHAHDHSHTHSHANKESLVEKVIETGKDLAVKAETKLKSGEHKKHKHLHSSDHRPAKLTPSDPSMLPAAHTHGMAPIMGHAYPEPIMGHHQNIGGHHLPAAAVPVGHNMAYDAALASGPAPMSHSARDAELMNKIVKSHTLQEQQSGTKKNINIV